MVGFEYYGKSTQNVIGTPLYLVAYDGIEGLGATRNKVEGERTISRFITNEYGTIYEPLSFTYALQKSDCTIFTTQEQIEIEKWLTSPKLSSELKITNCDEYSYSYFGLFTTTRWEIGDGGLPICVFTFQVNGAYAYRYVEYTATSARYNDEGELDHVENSFTMQVDCDTDELEEYVYPSVKATAIGFGENSSFTFTNYTDGGNSVTVTTERMTTMMLDSQYCIIAEYAEGVTQNFYVNLLKFKDIGWNDVGNIYWPRLLPGMNNIEIEGHVDVVISFYLPHKVVGGWLV